MIKGIIRNREFKYRLLENTRTVPLTMDLIYNNFYAKNDKKQRYLLFLI